MTMTVPTTEELAEVADLARRVRAQLDTVLSGLDDAIAATEGMTVFVPSNEALSAGPQDAISDLLADPERLSGVITYYAVPGKVMAADAMALAESGPATVTTVNGADLTISVMDGNVMIEGATGATATVVTPDIEIGNVVVHVIDGLVLPEAPAN